MGVPYVRNDHFFNERNEKRGVFTQALITRMINDDYIIVEFSKTEFSYAKIFF